MKTKPDGPFGGLLKSLREASFVWLFVLTLLLLVGYPLLRGPLILHLLRGSLFVAIFLPSIIAYRHSRALLFITLVLVLISQVTLVIEVTTASVLAGLWHSAANAAYFGLIIFVLMRFIGRQHSVTHNVVFAAQVVYVLLAFVWTFAFEFLEALQPDSFAHVSGADADVSWRADFLYFSLITITTTGFGDIVPLTPLARMLTTLEALVGQIYLVVIVAIIVGLRTVEIVESRRAREARKD